MISFWGFVLHPGAAQDISDIWEFVAQENLVAAGRLREQILDSIRKLAPFPNQGHLRPDLTSRPLRFQITGNYLIAYAPEKTPPVVIAVVDGRRSPRILAAILRERR
jgi:plasmid stabilization system protein ParE